MAPADYDAAVLALRSGKVVVIPTDTVYGVAVDPTRPLATDRLFVLKRRPTDVAVPVLVAERDQARELTVDDLPAAAEKLMAAFWPGGLTLVLPRRPGLQLDLGGPDDCTIGLRLPAHEVPRTLALRVGPLAVTSANLHGRPTPPTAAEVAEQLGRGPALVVDGGRCEGTPSTVASVTPDGEVTILREGRVPGEAVLDAAR